MLEGDKVHRNVAMQSAENEITIEKLVYGGAGLGRIDGEVVLAPYVLPGERATVTAAERRSGVSRAELVTVDAPSPHRILPGCPYFGRCGGCQYQHASYAYQVEQKREILREQLRRVGRIEPPVEIHVISGPEWEYRNRTQLHVARGRIGYLEAGTHKLCPVEKCPISSPLLNEHIRTLVEMARDRRFPDFIHGLELFTNETETQVNVLETDRPVARRFFEWCAEKIPGALAPALEYPAAGFLFRVGRRSFFQVNRFLVDKLVDAAIGGFSGARALDLYAGVGLFSLPLARTFAEVIAVESGSGAVDDLQFNAQRALAAVNTVKRQAEEFLTSFSSSVDLIVADPPRSGLGKRVVAELLRIRPRTLVIVACDPSTLARDLAVLISGRFCVNSMTMVDLFAQTFHLETIVRLTCES